MKHSISEKILIPEGVSCYYNLGILKCSNNNGSLERKLNLPNLDVQISSDSIVFECKKGNKQDYKKIKSAIAHVNNIFSGLNEKFIYKLEACNVHFPMTLKVDSRKLIISNFLGEKTSRVAVILPNVDVEVKGTLLTLTSNDRNAAGQTAANMEKATKIKARDRRVYQDGIFITSKPGRKI